MNNILLLPQFPDKPDILMLLDDKLLLSRNRGQSWVTPGELADIQTGFTVAIAPLGLDAHSVMFLGSDEGNISTIILE